MERNGELGRKGAGQSSEGHLKDPVWLDVWQLRVPSKLQHFIWKGCKNILAVRVNLQCRGMQLETCCPQCGEDTETHVHLFFKCSFARVFWFGSPLQLDVNLVEGDDFLECWKWLWKKYSDEVEADKLMRWVVCGLWRLWKCRNTVVFEKSIMEPRSALESLFRQWSEFEGEGGSKELSQGRNAG
ncbi:hypothetical protein EV1_025134 [Malus domestica]